MRIECDARPLDGDRNRFRSCCLYDILVNTSHDLDCIDLVFFIRRITRNQADIGLGNRILAESSGRYTHFFHYFFDKCIHGVRTAEHIRRVFPGILLNDLPVNEAFLTLPVRIIGHHVNNFYLIAFSVYFIQFSAAYDIRRVNGTVDDRQIDIKPPSRDLPGHRNKRCDTAATRYRNNIL